MSDLEFGPEWRSLELLCMGLDDPQIEAQFNELVTSELHWGELIEQACRHRIHYLLAERVSDNAYDRKIPRFATEWARESLKVNRNRVRLMRNSVAEVTDALSKAGISFAWTKGIALESTVYKGGGGRALGDLDLMASPSDNDEIVRILTELGYETGMYNWHKESIVPHKRSDQILYRLNPDHVPILTKTTGDPIIQSVYLDIANSLTWHGSDWHIPVEEAIADLGTFELDGKEAPCLNKSYHFVFVALHLFREAWFERYLQTERDVTLAKFADALRLWQEASESTREETRQLANQYQVLWPLLWVGTHLDALFGTRVATMLGFDPSFTSDDLNRVSQAPGAPERRWTGTMRSRLHSKNRNALYYTVTS